MLFQFQGKPQHLTRLFKLFRGMAPRLRQHRSRYAWAVTAASLVYLAVCAFALPRVDVPLLGIFWFFLSVGISFMLWAWAFSSVLRRYPCNKKSTASRVALSIVLSVVALIGGFIAYDNGLESLGEATATLQTWAIWAIWAIWAWAGLGVFLSSRWIVWLRLRDEMLQDYELDFLYQLMLPLLRDLPPDAACSFSCNPFTPMWSERFSTESHGQRRLEISDDVLLDFKAKLDEGASLALQTVTRRVDKYKSKPKKTKFKGTSFRVAMVCRFQHPALAGLGEAEIRQLGQVCESLERIRRGYEMRVRRDLAAGKITVAGKARFSNLVGLGAANLPDVEAMLKTVRALSAFTARLGPAQKPA